MSRLFACFTILLMTISATAFGETIADSEADFTTTGTHGEKGWSNGYYNRSADDNDTYDDGDFIPFAPPEWVWTGSAWDWADGNVPWTTVFAAGGHPNGDNNGDIHYAVRRWESNYSGPASVSFHLAKQNVNCGNGTTALLFHNGNEIGSITVAGDDGVGLSATADVTLSAGDHLDLALSPQGADGSFNDGCDGSAFGMQVQAVPEPSSAVLLMMGAMGLLGLRRRK